MAQDLPQSVADRRTASFLLAVILAGMLLDFVGSAAIRDTPFWKDACSVTAKTRHGRSATNSIVQSQLNHAISKINTLMKKNLPAMFPKGQYPKSSTNNNPNCINTIKFLKQMRRNKTQALGLFHENLQRYAGAIYNLNNVQIKSPAKSINEAQRATIFDESSSELKLVLCEVQRQLDENGSHFSAIDLDKNCNHYGATADITTAGVNYHFVFSNLRKFLKGSKRILSGATKRKGKGTKKQNRQHKNKQVKS